MKRLVLNKKKIVFFLRLFEGLKDGFEKKNGNRLVYRPLQI